MKKAILYIFLILLLVGGIIVGVTQFYESTGYYIWTEEATTSSVLRIKGTFVLNNDYRRITASGEIINCTSDEIVINSSDITLYCRDNRTNEVYSFKNVKVYNLTPEKKTEIEIPIYDGSQVLNGPDEAKKIYNNYEIVKIEYQNSVNDTRELKTIAETGSYFMPLGICLAVPILLSLIVAVAIFIIQCSKQKSFNFVQAIKYISTNKKILISVLFLTAPLSFIISGLFAFRDKHWSISAYCSISVISGLIIVVLLLFILLLVIKAIRKKKLLQVLTNKIIALNEEIKPIEEPYNDKIQKLNSLMANKKLEIKKYTATIDQGKSDDNMIFADMYYIDNLNGLQFEEYCVKIFTKLGYSAIKTKSSGDFGADIILNGSISVQCKLYKGPVGLHALQEAYSSMAKYKTNSVWVITNSTFTKAAIEYAKDASIRLIDRNQLKQLAQRAFSVLSAAEIINLRKKIKDLQEQISEMEEEIDNIYCNVIPQAKLLREDLRKLELDANSLETLNYKQINSQYKNYIKIQ